MVDKVNAAFVLAAVVLAALDIAQIRRDRRLDGMHALTACLLTIWPLWDMYYYAHLGQLTSLLVCSALATLRIVWFGHVLRTMRGKHPK